MTKRLVVAVLVSCGRDPSNEPPASTGSAIAPRQQTPTLSKSSPPKVPAAIPGDMSPIPDRGGSTAFYLDRTEVTVQAYAECVAKGACAKPSAAAPCDGVGNNSAHGRDQHPVNCVTTVDAWKYCRFRDKRLPSSDELILASTLSKDAHFPWGSTSPTCAQAVLAGCGDAGTSPVGSRAAGRSDARVDDLIGNVAEIVGSEPARPFDSMLEVYDPSWSVLVHGGSYGTARDSVMLHAELINEAYIPSPEVGFRCASSMPGDDQVARFH